MSVVVIGAGLAGFRFAQSLRAGGYEAAVTVVGDESFMPYDRPPLSKQFLAGEFDADKCALPGEAPSVDWVLGRRAERLDRSRRVVTLDDGAELSYDRLVIASGRRARPWPGPVPAHGVYTLRSLGDAEGLRAATAGASAVVIVGAGFIGCEVAATLRKQGVAVTVVDIAPHPMPVLGPDIGGRARALHVQHGVNFRLGSSVAAIVGDDRVEAVVLQDGERLAADVVLVATGSLPNSEWLLDAGLLIEHGAVVCDATGTVLDAAGSPVPDVFAAGDIAAWPHPHAPGAAAIEHWSNARDMADLAAANLFVPHAERAALTGNAAVPAFWSDQYDVKIKSVGLLRSADRWEMLEEDPERNVLLAEAYRGDQLVGAVAFNLNRSILKYHRRLAEHAEPAATGV